MGTHEGGFGPKKTSIIVKKIIDSPRPVIWSINPGDIAGAAVGVSPLTALVPHNPIHPANPNKTEQNKMANGEAAVVKQHKDLDDVESLRSHSGSSTESSRSIRRKEEFVYIPYSYQIEQSLTSCLLGGGGDETPVMLRSEKAQLRQQQRQRRRKAATAAPSNYRLKRFTSIIYGYSALFLFLAIHSYMTWRDDNYHNSQEEEQQEQQQEQQQQLLQAEPAIALQQPQPWNNPNNALFGITPPKSRDASSSAEEGAFSGNTAMARYPPKQQRPLPSSVSFSYETKIPLEKQRKPVLVARKDEGNEEEEEEEDGASYNEPDRTQDQQGPLTSTSSFSSSGRTPYQRPPNTIPFPPVTSPLYFDALDESGRGGYIADPKALRNARDKFLTQLRQQQQQSQLDEEQEPVSLSPPDEFWAILEHVGTQARYGTRTAHVPLSAQAVCAPGPGRGMEDEGGYKLFAEKIQIAPPLDEEEQEDVVDVGIEDENNTEDDIDNNPVVRRLKRDNKLLCAVYSHAGMYDLARTAALTWGYKCDGFLVFGDSPSIPDLGFVKFIHKGPEAYGNLWQKVRSIWAYLHHNYSHEYQYFHLGGDDMYVIPENLKWRLSQKHVELPNAPIFMGQQVPLGGGKNLESVRSYVTGGPGYTLNRKGLELLVTQALPDCHVGTVAPYEDRLLTGCLNQIGLSPMDSRDPTTGEQTYHGVAPHTLYTTRNGSKSFHGKAQQYWQQQSHPRSNSPVGPQYGLESAARYSVSFHNLFHPIFMVRVHTLLYPELCPVVQQLEEEEEPYEEQGYEVVGYETDGSQQQQEPDSEQVPEGEEGVVSDE